MSLTLHFRNYASITLSLGHYYHNLKHIESVLETTTQLSPHAQDLHAVRLAVWLHDVIFDSTARKNEAESAHYAHQLC